MGDYDGYLATEPGVLPLCERALAGLEIRHWSQTVHWPTSINGRKMDTYHRWMEVVIGGSLAGAPVLNLPGFDDRGRPMGVQFIGPTAEDRRVLEFAMAYEAVTEHLNRRPALKTACRQSPRMTGAGC